MINVPPHPFKFSEIDEADPFIVNALKKHRHFDPCWCGSGKKYKKCHMNREQEKSFTIGKIKRLQRDVFWKKRGCMHPQSSKAACGGKVIDSHTIQRKGPLSRIVDDSGHVMHFELSTGGTGLSAQSIGWRKASTFPGYCSHHDSELFSPIEKTTFDGGHKQCVLHAFRNLCNEIYRKQALIESLEFQKNVLDRGKNLDRQIEIQYSCNKNIKGQRKSLEESKSLRANFEKAIVGRNYEALESRCYFFEGEISVVSSSVFQCEYDFQGNKLVDMWDLSIDAELLSHSIVNTEKGGVIVFVWQKDGNQANAVIESFEKIPDDEKGDIFVQYCFVNAENTYFSALWWASLPAYLKAQISGYAGALYYEGGAFVANKPRLVDWKFI